MLGFTLIHVSKRGHWSCRFVPVIDSQYYLCHAHMTLGILNSPSIQVQPTHILISYTCMNKIRQWFKEPRHLQKNLQYNILYRDLIRMSVSCVHRDDVIKWKHFPRYWPFVRGIHRSQGSKFKSLGSSCESLVVAETSMTAKFMGPTWTLLSG